MYSEQYENVARCCFSLCVTKCTVNYMSIVYSGKVSHCAVLGDQEIRDLWNPVI